MYRMKNYFIVASVLALTFIVGFILLQKKDVSFVTPEAQLVKSETLTGVEQKIYQNRQSKFLFRYPGDWTVEEVDEIADSEIHPDWHFRFVVLKTPDFSISIGVKNQSETSLQIQPGRTGIPAGDFEKGKAIAVAQGMAEKQYLVYRDSENGIEKETQMLWYCKKNNSVARISGPCDNFSIGKGRVAFVGVDALGNTMSEEAWNNIEKQVDTVLASLTDTSHWKTHIDKKYGFQFQYPANTYVQTLSQYSDAGGEEGIMIGTINRADQFWMSIGVFTVYENPEELFKDFSGSAGEGDAMLLKERVVSGQSIYLKKTINSVYSDYNYVIPLRDKVLLLVSFRAEKPDEDYFGWQCLPTVQAVVESIKTFR